MASEPEAEALPGPDSPRREREPAGAGAVPGAIRLRPSRPSDAPSFLELFRTVAAEGRFIRTEAVERGVGHYRRQFRRSWTGDQASITAAVGRRVVGHLSISREEHPSTRHVASLGMMVAPGWRGRGIGRALLAEAVRWGREVGVEKIALTVYPDNRAARALYREFGFEEEGRLSGHSKKASGYHDEIVMGLWVSGRPGGGES